MGDVTIDFSKSRMNLLYEHLCSSATNEKSKLTFSEFSLFVEYCRAKQLDPVAKQIYAIKRVSEKYGTSSVTYQTSIDGFRLIAHRSGLYQGQIGPFYCGKDGNWIEFWEGNGFPLACKVGVVRKDFRDPIHSVAIFKEYVVEKNALWFKMPCVMIAKCAEAAALRRAFPGELSGLYSSEEMEQADKDLGGSLTKDEKAAAIDIPSRERPQYKQTYVKKERPPVNESILRFGDKLRSLIAGKRTSREEVQMLLNILNGAIDERKPGTRRFTTLYDFFNNKSEDIAVICLEKLLKVYPDGK